MMKRKLILEDGSVYIGEAFGSEDEKYLELVFNTSMVGYQEIISDPSYTDQAVVLTYPVIGNYGINAEDYETICPSIGALIVKEYVDEPSNFRCERTLSDCMKEFHIAGISDIDTRTLTRKIREIGSCKVLLTGEETSDAEGLQKLRAWNYATDQVARVSTKEFREFAPEGEANGLHVVIIDCGMKLNIVRSLCKLGCKVTAVPYNTSAEAIKALAPNGIMISNGPGNPEDVKETIETVRALHGVYPIFGICLGHQIIALSYGAKTYKLKFGHRGGNHPVKNLLTDKLEITSQNHSYAVNQESAAAAGLEITHLNLLDNTVEGQRFTKDRIFSVQYHPESAPGPQDSQYLFDDFLKLMKED